MGNWINRGLKKQKENEKRKNKIKLKNLIENEIIINITSSFALLFVTAICMIVSFISTDDADSANMGLVLAMMSLFVTFAFEGYEWFKLFSKRIKKTSTIPFMIAYALLILLTIIKVKTNIWESIIKYTNFICAITLCLYIVLATIRTIISNIKQIKASDYSEKRTPIKPTKTVKEIPIKSKIKK